MYTPLLRAFAARWKDDLFVADWRPTLFVHFAVPPALLARRVPLPLDTYKGHAFVSLVFFRLERMRPAGSGMPGRWLARPISEHPFLNVRTYVRGASGPGIHFLTEWIPNRLSLLLGPRTYGLPYRFAHFCGGSANGGVETVHITDPELDASLHLSFPTREMPLTTAGPGSRDEFLLERYIAYTRHRGVDRYFHVRHEPWQWFAPDWIRTDTELVCRAFPWFEAAEYVGAHRSPGAFNVRMGRPHRLANAPEAVPFLDCAGLRA